MRHVRQEADCGCIQTPGWSRSQSMSAVSIRSREVSASERLWRRLLVIAAVGQAVSSVLA